MREKTQDIHGVMSNNGVGIGRRDFLRKAVGGATAILLPWNNASALDPATVGTAIQIMKFGVDAAKLFQGTSANDMDEVLFHMLDNINRHLKTIQDSITLVLEKLDEVKRLIGEVPSAVVQELSTSGVHGSVRAYGELLRLRAEYGKDEERFLKERSAEARSLLEKIRSNRNVLMNYPNHVNVPVLATALHIEYGCMRLIKETDEPFVAMAETYRDYFKKMLFGSGGMQERIKALRNERTEVLKNMDKPQFEVMRVNDAGIGYGYWNANIGFSMFTTVPLDDVKPTVPLDDVKPEVLELIQLGLIDPDERELSVRKVSEMRFPCRPVAIHTVEFDGTRKTLGVNEKSVKAAPLRSARLATLEQNRKAHEDTHNLAVMRLYAAVSGMHAGNRALNFTLQFA